nr:uncharacterized protein LOC108071356 isoform X4 [Drosophila kikkawai]
MANSKDNITNPNEHLEIPKWINEEYFAQVLNKDEPQYEKILSFKPVAAIPPGENFTSIMLRIHFDLQMRDGSTKHKTYIFKTMLAEDRGGKEIREGGIFDKELMMYQTYLPAFEELYRAAGEQIQLAPKCLHTDQRENGIHFVFEDLGVKKFRNVDRIQGLDLAHMKRSLRKLAEFHAAASVYAGKNGSYPDDFEEGFIAKDKLELHEQGFNVKARSYHKAMDGWGLEDQEKYLKSFVLNKDEPQYEKILSFKPVAAIPPGENFTSIMLRIHFDLQMRDGSTKHKTYIFKTMLAEDRGGKEIREGGIFDKELMMYQTYLPAFEELYRAAGEQIQLAPKCLHTDQRENGIHFVFEDLGVKKFRNVDRIQGLDLAHMKRSLRKLAEFHAAASVYAGKNGSYPDDFEEGFIAKDKLELHEQGFNVKARSYHKAMDGWGLEDQEKYLKSFVLNKDEPQYEKILSFKPVAAIPPGENFTSIMLRIHFDLQMRDGSTKHKTYIFKTMLAEDRGGKEIREGGIFDKELMMYQTYLPAFEELYRAAGEQIQLAPKCLHTDQRENGIHFVFEDLGVKKFRNVDRIQGLDLAHMKRSLRKLAEFHAAASVYAGKNGSYPDDFEEGFIAKDKLELHEQGFNVKARSYHKAMDGWGLEDQEKYLKSFVLNKDEPQYEKILSFKPVAAIPPGENFTSIMLRIHFDLQMRDGSTKHKTYIFKTMLAEDRGGKEIREGGIFDKELMMYQTYLPAFEELYRAAGEQIQLAPKCLHTDQRENGIHFVFEDLGVKKFRNVDRIQGLDLAHMKRSLRKLAEFHAAASVYAGKNGSYPDDFEEGFIAKDKLELHEQGFNVKARSYHKAMDGWGLEDQEKYLKSFVLNKDEPQYEKILSFKPVAAIPPGENFTSIMLRIHFDLQMRDGSTKHKTYIFKTMLAEDRGGKEIREGGIFDKELMMYQTYLPAFEELYRAAGEQIQLAPKCLHTDQRENGIHFVFEDLGVKKFRNVDRIQGLDLAHMKRSLRKLAEFHAAASVYAGKNGSYPDDFEEGFIAKDKLELHEQGFNVKARSYHKAMDGWGLEDQEKYLKSFKEKLWIVNIAKITKEYG